MFWVLVGFRVPPQLDTFAIEFGEVVFLVVKLLTKSLEQVVDVLLALGADFLKKRNLVLLCELLTLLLGELVWELRVHFVATETQDETGRCGVLELSEPFLRVG